MCEGPPETKTTFLLEMTGPEQLCGKRVDLPELEIRRVEIPCPEFSWFLHEAVGADYRWGGREDWGRREWTECVERPEMETWVAYVSGAPAGYYELQRQADGSVRILHFGLLPAFVDKGLGGRLLTEAVTRAWAMGAARVWLSTCSHDHPRALPNYLARGFTLVSQTEGPANRARRSALFGGRGGRPTG